MARTIWNEPNETLPDAVLELFDGSYEATAKRDDEGY